MRNSMKKVFWFAIGLGIATIIVFYIYSQKKPWKKEYEHYLAVIEYQMENDTETGKKEIVSDFLDALKHFIQVCEKNSFSDERNEKNYRMAVFMLREAYYRYLGTYRYTDDYKNVPEGLEDFWDIAHEETRHIDYEIHLLREEFQGIADEKEIDECASMAWEEEFYHCADVIRKEIEQSGNPDKEKALNTLEAFEELIGVWGDCNKDFQKFESDSYGNAIAVGKMDVFCLGTVILIDRYQDAGGEYEFIYNSETDRQRLLEIYGED